MLNRPFLHAFFPLCLAAVSLAQTNNEIFEKMVGPGVMLDPDITAGFLLNRPDQKFSVDSDLDGRIDVMYMIDNDWRHSEEHKPLLVKIVDEDGDMYLTGEGDLDSDLYIADWFGDGTIDRVIDYIDLDGDNDLDEQLFYRWTAGGTAWDRHLKPSNFIGGRAYSVGWMKDYGDDNRLWYDVDYEYDQDLCQWLTDFNGDEMCIWQFFFDYKQNILEPKFEIPFSFYDHDGDSFAEEVTRFSGYDKEIGKLRHSLDLDNDTRVGNEHDFDMGITALGRLTLPDGSTMKLTIRGIETTPVVKWEQTRLLARNHVWAKTHLTWDENDNNVDPRPGNDHNERWEGVLNHPNEYMAQVGGPSGGPHNKRNEVDTDCSGAIRFYYSPIDRRIHLFGADKGWIDVDYDYDESLDMTIRMEDQDRDGFFDTWKYDSDADGTLERVFTITGDEAELYPYDWKILHELYLPSLKETLEANRRLIEALKAVLAAHEEGYFIDLIEQYFCTSITGYTPEDGPGDKIKNSLEGIRYYGDLIRERYWQRLAETDISGSRDFPMLQKAYEAGDFLLAARLIEDKLLEESPRSWYSSLEKRFAIELVNPSTDYLDNQPFVLEISEIAKAAPDFNPANYVLVDAGPWLDWRVIPSQVDDLDGDRKGDELAFVYSLTPAATAKLHCYYSPGGSAETSYSPQTEARLEASAAVLWESNRGGYLMQGGRIVPFGNLIKGLRWKKAGKLYDNMTERGIKLLESGKSSGLGGISIWEGKVRIPLLDSGRMEGPQIKYEVLSRGPVRSLVQAVFSDIRTVKGKYAAALLMSTFSGSDFSRQDFTISSAPGSQTVIYSPGVQKLTNESWSLDSPSGVFTGWGTSIHQVKEVGQGLIFNPGEYSGFEESDLDRYVKLKTNVGSRSTHWITGGWREGFTSPVAPTGKDWALQVRKLALRLKLPVRVRCYPE